MIIITFFNVRRLGRKNKQTNKQIKRKKKKRKTTTAAAATTTKNEKQQQQQHTKLLTGK